MRKCAKCGKGEGYAEFTEGKICTKCNTATKRAWARSHPISAMLSSAKKRAKKRGIEFDLVESDIEIPSICPVLDIPLFQPPYTGKPGPLPNSPTLDRIDNTKGYIKGNVVVISHRANSIKHDASCEDLEKVLNWLKSISRGII